MSMLETFSRVTSYGEAAELLKSKMFRQCGHARVSEAPVTADSLISLHGEAHFARRRLENPLFTRDMLRQHETNVLRPAIRHTLHNSPEADGYARIDLLAMTRRAMLRVTAALLGLAVDDDASVDELAAFAEVFAPAAALVYKQGSIEAPHAAALGALERFRKRFYDPAVAIRKPLASAYLSGEANAAELPSDLLSTLLVHLGNLPEDMMLREITLFIVASTDTTTHGVGTTFEHLSEWFVEHPEDKRLATDPEFLRSAVYEAIRLHPPPAALREAIEEVTLSTGRTFANGEQVIVDLVASNRDPSVFGSDPDLFDPRREVPSRIHPYGLGFGGGAHTCIGRGMATMSGMGDDHDETLGTVVCAVQELFDAEAQLDPADPPQLRTGWAQERYERFTVLVPSARRGRA
jgi:cytochrome P450